MATYPLILASGELVNFVPGLQPHSSWNDVSGVYLFVRQMLSGKWQIAYVGKAESLRGRGFAGHGAWPDAQQLGATEIHASVSMFAADAERLERDIYREFMPPCNKIAPPAPNALTLAAMLRASPAPRPAAGLLSLMPSAYEQWSTPERNRLLGLLRHPLHG
jgi:hypothetical protein